MKVFVIFLSLILSGNASSAVVKSCSNNIINLYNGAHTAKNLYGEEINLSEFSGKISLIVNTACYDDDTSSQMQDINNILEEYSSNVVALAFPCNQFGNSEPGEGLEILNCYTYVRPGYGFLPHYNFFIFDKVKVNGISANNLFHSLKKACSPLEKQVAIEDVHWLPDISSNYEKFLVDSNGHVRYRFDHDVSMGTIVTYIQDLQTVQTTTTAPPTTPRPTTNYPCGKGVRCTQTTTTPPPTTPRPTTTTPTPTYPNYPCGKGVRCTQTTTTPPPTTPRPTTTTPTPTYPNYPCGKGVRCTQTATTPPPTTPRHTTTTPTPTYPHYPCGKGVRCTQTATTPPPTTPRPTTTTPTPTYPYYPCGKGMRCTNMPRKELS